MSAAQRLLPIARALARQGLRILADAHFGSVAGAPSSISVSTSAEASRVLVVGQAGPEMWRHFSVAPEYQDGLPHPLDRWSRRTGDALAQQFGCAVVYPFSGPPFHPFQHWLRAGQPGMGVSPLGILIHPRWGGWISLRFALLLPGQAAWPAKTPVREQGQGQGGPCQQCVTKPCLRVCPVNAVSAEAGFAAQCCLSHVRDRDAECRTMGCAVRQACPVGRAFMHSPAQQRFHLQAFCDFAAGAAGAAGAGSLSI